MSDFLNRIQDIKMRSLSLFPSNKMHSTVCDGVVLWWEFFERGKPTCVLEHDFDDTPDNVFMQKCLEPYYGATK